MEKEPQTTDARKRSVLRSPKYPGLTFNDALARVRTVYDNDKRSPVKPETVLEHLGLAPGSGPANRILSALKQYGLLDEREGKLKVSDAAYRIIHLSEESPERVRALREAALKPQVIQDVLVEYPDGLPSDANLRDYLIGEKQFNPDAVSFFIKVLRDNLAVAEEAQTAYDSTMPPAEGDVNEGSGRVGMTGDERLRRGEDALSPFNYPLSRECTGIVRFRGQPTRADVDRLIQFLELSKSAFPDED